MTSEEWIALALKCEIATTDDGLFDVAAALYQDDRRAYDAACRMIQQGGGLSFAVGIVPDGHICINFGRSPMPRKTDWRAQVAEKVDVLKGPFYCGNGLLPGPTLAAAVCRAMAAKGGAE